MFNDFGVALSLLLTTLPKKMYLSIKANQIQNNPKPKKGEKHG
jgi:hypothetical protein